MRRWFLPERNFFAALALARYRLIGNWGPDPVRFAIRIDSGGILVDITSSCPTPALSSAVCPCAVGQPGLRRCLRGRDAGSAGPGPESTGSGSFDANSAVSAVHE